MKALLFDLDDTLYLEGEFVASGYRALARHVERRFGPPSREVFLAMMTTFSASGRLAVLPMVSDRFTGGKFPVSEMVELYRQHRPLIRLLPGYSELLGRLGRRFKLAVVTDGLPAVQRRKATVLGLDRLVDAVVCTWDFGRDRQKPDPLPFERVLHEMRIPARDALFVGDNAEKDGRGAANAGLGFVHVRQRLSRQRSRYCSEVRPVGFVESLFQLPQLLDQLN